MSEWAISTLRRIIRDLDVYQDGRHMTDDALDSFIVSLELVYRDLVAQQIFDVGAGDVHLQDGTRLVQTTLETFRTLKDEMFLRSSSQSIQPTTVATIGRPTFIISYQQLSFLVENRFTVPQIADMLGVSVRTVHRRLAEYSQSIRSQYSDITDGELDSIVQQVHSQFLMCGNSQMCGHLLARGLRVQQYRIRESQRRVDPDGCIMRRLSTINRRHYSVPAPRSLYHIDGNHKLIRQVDVLYRYVCISCIIMQVENYLHRWV